LNRTIAELADIDDLPPIDFRDLAAEALRPYRQLLLARERLRYGLPCSDAAPGSTAAAQGAITRGGAA
jgi:hypothetical protein